MNDQLWFFNANSENISETRSHFHFISKNFGLLFSIILQEKYTVHQVEVDNEGLTVQVME